MSLVKEIILCNMNTIETTKHAHNNNRMWCDCNWGGRMCGRPGCAVCSTAVSCVSVRLKLKPRMSCSFCCPVCSVVCCSCSSSVLCLKCPRNFATLCQWINKSTVREANSDGLRYVFGTGHVIKLALWERLCVMALWSKVQWCDRTSQAGDVMTRKL